MQPVHKVINAHKCLITGSQSASPSKPLCLEENRIAWRGYQPYIMNISNVNNTGVVSNLFRIALRSCCRGELNLIYQLEYSGQNEAAGIAMNDTIDFIMPVQMNTKSKKYLTKPFVSAGEILVINYLKFLSLQIYLICSI